MPWYQPQHLHLVPTVQLAEMLRECGFEPVEWHTGSAHSLGTTFYWPRWYGFAGSAPTSTCPGEIRRRFLRGSDTV